MTNKFRPILDATGLSMLAVIVHLAIAYFLKLPDGLSLLAVLYGALFTATAIILLILIKIMFRNIDNVGYTFMLLTCIKMVIIYLVFKTFATEIGTEGLPKAHLIAAFFVMLGVETWCTVRMLNKN